MGESSSAAGVTREPLDDAGPLIRLRVAFSPVIWRIGPAWATMAGAAAAGAWTSDTAVLLRLIAAVLLSDVGWGILRQYAGSPVKRNGRLPAVPYLAAGSPLARLLAALAPGVSTSETESGAGWQHFVSGLVLTGAIGLLLGPAALALSAIALALIWLARALYQRGSDPAFCLALLDVGLPWMLGVAFLGRFEVVAAVALPWPAFALAAGFTIVQWALYRAVRSEIWRGPAFWLACLCPLLPLVWAREVVAAVLAVALSGVPLWLSGRDAGGMADRWFSGVSPWLWLAMWVAAVAVGA